MGKFLEYLRFHSFKRSLRKILLYSQQGTHVSLYAFFFARNFMERFDIETKTTTIEGSQAIGSRLNYVKIGVGNFVSMYRILVKYTLLRIFIIHCELCGLRHNTIENYESILFLSSSSFAESSSLFARPSFGLT